MPETALVPGKNVVESTTTEALLLLSLRMMLKSHPTMLLTALVPGRSAEEFKMAEELLLLLLKDLTLELQLKSAMVLTTIQVASSQLLSLDQLDKLAKDSLRLTQLLLLQHLLRQLECAT